jgi:hypothetical protein
VAGAWANCLAASSDVKELTPEFFYAPDFLRNADGHALGTRQVAAALVCVGTLGFQGLRCRLCTPCSACMEAHSAGQSCGVGAAGRERLL